MTAIWQAIGDFLFKLVAFLGAKKLGRQEAELEAWKQGDEYQRHIVETERKIREAMGREPADPFNYWRRLPDNPDSGDDPALHRDAGPASPEKPSEH